MVMERAIKFTAPEYEHFKDELERRQWLKLAAIPSPARSHLVEEFYANLRHTTSNRVLIRGHQRNFSLVAINRFYQTPEVENDTFTQMRDGEVNWDEVL